MRVYPIVLLAFALAACGDEEASTVAEGSASGEVLPGSISDDMIALDQLRSEAESDPDGESVADDGDTSDGGDASAISAAEPTVSAPAPAPTPQPAPAKAQPKTPEKAATGAPPPPVSVLPTKNDD